MLKTNELAGFLHWVARTRKIICDSTLQTYWNMLFSIPEVCEDSYLSLCPQIMLFGLFFADNAFEFTSLAGPGVLSKLCVPPGCNEIPLNTKSALADNPIFRDMSSATKPNPVRPLAATGCARCRGVLFRRMGLGSMASTRDQKPLRESPQGT